MMPRHAVLQDGSPGAFYWHPATNESHKNDWVLAYKGDGWCFDYADCLGRSKGGFGTSTQWANETHGWNGGILGGGDPVFGGMNKVIMENCDGASLTGDMDDPVMVPDGEATTPLYFRGRRIRDAILDTLIEDHGLGKAENVLLTGCSSGGLAAYLHSDYVHEKIKAASPSLKKFKTLGVSGFFLQHDSVDKLPGE